MSLLDELDEVALRSRLEFFFATHGLKPAHVAREASISRQHLLRVRKGLMEPTRAKIAQIVSAVRRLTLLDVQPADLFELTIEENGTWALASVRDEVASQTAMFVYQMRANAQFIAEVLQHPTSEWERRFTARKVSEPLVRQIILTANRALVGKPERAIAIHAVAARLVAQLPRFVNSDLRAALAGRTFLDRATAFRYLGRFPDAAKMADRAEEVFRSTPYCTHELAQAWYERAAIHFRCGEDDEASAFAQRARNIYVLTADRRRVAKAQMLEACILVDRRKFAPARDSFAECAAVFKAFEDEELCGSALLNLGSAEMHLSHLRAARDAFQAALKIFLKLGERAEVIRVRWNIAHLATFHGKAESGLPLLRQARADFINIGAHDSAGSVGLDILRALFAFGGDTGESITLARAILREFQQSGATKNAIEALAYLRDAVERHAATAPLVEDVQRFVERAPRHPNAVFSVPS